MIDIHSHILYGLDDGAQSLDESIQMAKIAVRDGIKKVVGTPHLFRGDYNSKDLNIVQKIRKELEDELEKQNIPLEIYTGAEVHLSHRLIDEIGENKPHLVINNGSYMLLEFPTSHIFSGTKDLFFQLMSEGITPIIAHPERNTVFLRNSDLLYELISMGALVQANSGSFSGIYGSRIREAVDRFLINNFIHFIGTDAHNVRSMPPRLSTTVRKIRERVGEKHAYALVFDNPEAVLASEPIPFRPEPVAPKQRARSFKVSLPKFFQK